MEITWIAVLNHPYFLLTPWRSNFHYENQDYTISFSLAQINIEKKAFCHWLSKDDLSFIQGF